MITYSAYSYLGFRASWFGIAAVVWLGLVDVRSVPIVWINELHYDNTGSDTGEFVEIAGEAATDLAGFKLVLYNGSGGTVYGTVSLTGVLPDEGKGFGAVAFLRSGIQNGAPDGLALVAPDDSVLQFLSYEGSFEATDGLASGLTSVDLGFLEDGSDVAGISLQLTGVGCSYDDFAWSGPVAQSPGSLNTGQTIQCSSVPDSLPSSFVVALFTTLLALIKPVRVRKSTA